MAAAKPIYDLILLLDLGAEDELRAKIVADARAAISAEGELLGDQAWGTRPLAYEIDHRESAEYHLLQFSGPAALISGLEHTLRITDGVIRHRVIKLPAGSTPVAASAPPAPSAVAPSPVESAPVESAPAGSPAAESAPAESAPAESAPAESPAAESPSGDGDPALVGA
jgi:small subunit ribosomal protein S6